MIWAFLKTFYESRAFLLQQLWWYTFICIKQISVSMEAFMGGYNLFDKQHRILD